MSGRQIRARLLLLIVVAPLVAIAGPAILAPSPVAACTGGRAPFEDGIHGATDIFDARIVAATADNNGFYRLDVAPGAVFRGRARTHLGGVVTPQACDEILVGQSGVVVLGSVDPFGVGHDDVYDFFYVVAPGRTTPSEVRSALHGLPATDVAEPIIAVPPNVPPIVLLAGVAAFGLVLRWGSRRQPAGRSVRPQEPSA